MSSISTVVKSMKNRLIFVAVILVVTACGSRADWPQYLGPNRNAISPETGLARCWPEDGPEVLWTLPLGPGYGGPAVSDGKVYVLDRLYREQDVLRCIDLASGKEQWSYAYDAPGRTGHPGSRSVPAIDGNYIYTCGPFGHVYCFDKRTHKPVWNKNVWKDFGGTRPPMWAVSQNPLIYADLLIIASQTQQAGVVGYDKLTGRVVWVSAALPGRTGYASPKVVKIDDEDHLVMISAGPPRPRRGGRTGQRRRFEDSNFGPGDASEENPIRGGGAPPDRRPGRPANGRPPRGPEGGPTQGQIRGVVVGIDLKTGKTLWSYDGWQCQNPVPSVTPIGEARLFITGGYGAGSAVINIEKSGDAFVVKELYTTEAFGTHVHPPILYKGHLYAHCTTTMRRDGMVCMDLEGNVKWKTERSPVFDKGGFILADGLVLSIDGREGILYLIEPDPQGFKKLASAKLLDTNECWAPLALVDGKLLIRDQKQMKCVAVR